MPDFTAGEPFQFWQFFTLPISAEPGATNLKKHQLLTEDDYRKARESYGDSFTAEMGAEAVRKLLEGLNLVDLSRDLRKKLEDENKKDKPSRQKLRDLVKRLFRRPGAAAAHGARGPRSTRASTPSSSAAISASSWIGATASSTS